MSDERDERSGFKVTDRRRFAGEAAAEARDEGPGAGDPGAGARARAAYESAGRAEPAGGGAAGRQPVTFASFVMGLSAQALMHLGEVAPPAGGEPVRDLVAAQHLIDILAVLETKTTGNLADEERALLEAVLYDLRMRYVQLARQSASDVRKETS